MAAETEAAAIRLHDLGVAYDGRPALRGLSGAFARGSLTAVVGPNGAGKSSLLAAIMGRLRPAAGRIELGVPATRIAWLAQRAAIDRSFPLNVFDLAALGLWRRVGSFGRMTPALRDDVARALQAVGLAGCERRAIGELSVGQFQRLLFARVLLQDTDVVLLDEPFAAVDARTTADLLQIVAGWHAQRRTVIAVLHDLDQVRRHFDRCLLLARDGIAWGPTAEVLSADNLLRARRQAERWDEAPQVPSLRWAA